MIYNSFRNKELSEIGFGTWGLSGDWERDTNPPDKIVIQSLLGLAYENGVNLFDTAPVYGRGIIELFLGEMPWKNEVLISTKIPAKVKPSAKALPINNYYDPEYIDSYALSSLRRLKRDRIDLLQLHNWSESWNDKADYFLAPLQRLKEVGAINFIGISLPDNFKSNIDEVLKLDIVDFIQAPYNPLQRWPETILFGQCRQKNVYLLLRSPFVHGLIRPCLQYSRIEINDRRSERVSDLGQVRAAVEDWLSSFGGGWENIKESIVNVIKSQLAGMGSIIIGMRQVEQIIENTRR